MGSSCSSGGATNIENQTSVLFHFERALKEWKEKRFAVCFVFGATTFCDKKEGGFGKKTPLG